MFCGGRFLSEECKLQPRDNSNILRCKSEAIKLRLRIERLKNKITEHDNSLFTKTTGKLPTGLTCHHKFNTDTLHFITTGIEKNIDNFVQDMERVMTTFSATFPILSTAKSSESRKRKESSAKANRRKIHATEAGKKRACFIFLSLGGSPIDNEYDRLIYGVQQIEGIDYEILSLFTSATDNACLRDLLNSRSFVGEGENVIKEFLTV